MKTLKILIYIVGIQVFFAVLLMFAIFMGQKADAKCKPEPPPVLKDCHPYPAAGPNAMQCVWVPRRQITPWSPPRCETR
jgi:hypothetical protein